MKRSRCLDSWKEVIMKIRLLMLAVFVTLSWTLTMAQAPPAQKAERGVAVPKYDVAAETTFAGEVEKVTDRECPMSGGLGSHLMLKLSDAKTIEVHLATAK